MNARIASIENLIARDPGGRNVFGLVVADQLRLAAQSLRLGRRVAIVSGFYIPSARAGETDGPPGAKAIGDALALLGLDVDYVTDAVNAPIFEAMGIRPTVLAVDPNRVRPSGESGPVVRAIDAYLDAYEPTHLVAIERVGRAQDGRYRNMQGVDISDTTEPLDELFLQATRRGISTIGIGDGGNEIGMGNVFAETMQDIPYGPVIACTVPTDFCVVAGVSNWGGYGLVGALSVLGDQDLLPSALDVEQDIRRAVAGGAVDGVTHRRDPTVDGLDLADSLRMLERIRDQIAPSPLMRGESLTVGVLGYGASGQAAAALLRARGHRVCLSEQASIALTPGLTFAGVETGGHSMDVLGGCDLVVASPGIRPDAAIRTELHRAGIGVLSELELAYQLGARNLIAVTGTIGKRETVEHIQRMFEAGGRSIAIGGNRGRPLSALQLDAACAEPDGDGPRMAVAVSSYQLETVVHFRPRIAALLNLHEAHAERHPTRSEYARIKSRVFMNQRGDDILILPLDDVDLRSLARKHAGRTLYVSACQEVDRGVWWAGGELKVRTGSQAERIAMLPQSPARTVLFALLVARLCGVSTAVLWGVVRDLTSEKSDK